MEGLIAMGFSCGFVGLPNVGKSTLFNALTSGKAAASNFPFCTIEPNTGIVPVPDSRLDVLTKLHKSKKVVPAVLKFIDIAGIVEGASKGQGLGNQFLGNIRGVDAVVHVARCFDDEDVTHVAGAVDPVRDLELIETELALADLDAVERRVQKSGKKIRSGDKEAQKEADLCAILLADLSAGRKIDFTGDDGSLAELASSIGLLTTKPALICANIGESQVATFERDLLASPLGAFASARGWEVVPVCAKLEEEISRLEPGEAKAFLGEMGLKESGLDHIIHVGYRILDYITFLTTGPDETRAWTVTRGSTAPQAAGKIHSDMERGFIRMEVIAYSDVITYGGESEAKTAGKMRIEGKEYVMRDGDVVFVRFSV